MNSNNSTKNMTIEDLTEQFKRQNLGEKYKHNDNDYNASSKVIKYVKTETPQWLLDSVAEEEERCPWISYWKN